MFKSFFVKPTATGLTSTPGGGASSTTPSRTASTSSSSSTNKKDAVTAAACADDSVKYQELDKLLRQTTPMHEILLHFKQRHGNIRLVKKKHRRPKKIMVTVDIDKESGANVFAQANSATFSELREIEVDSRMRTLKFFEDYRPAYFGTFSKRSKLLNGRKPFYKDSSLFNYDVDSEEDWSEEEEGEDIEMSDGDDDEKDELDEEDRGTNANELMYDDFFLQDNDFGSDADSDGEQMTATIIQRSSHKWAGVSVA